MIIIQTNAFVTNSVPYTHTHKQVNVRIQKCKLHVKGSVVFPLRLVSDKKSFDDRKLVPYLFPWLQHVYIRTYRICSYHCNTV